MVLLPVAVEAADPRAGSIAWPANAEKVGVTLTPPVPFKNYSVAVTPFVPKGGGYSPVNVCTYFGIAAKGPNSFTVYHRRCSDGALVKVDEPFQLDWIVAEHTQ
jgi:hypothetical protein